MNVVFQLASPGADIVFLLARVLFGAVLAFMGLNHFLNFDHTTGYAEMKGLPTPRLGVVASGGMLIFGDLEIAFGIFPTLAIGTVAVFLIVRTPVSRDFWVVPKDQREFKMTGFLKGLIMLGGALVFFALSGTTWSYAIGLTLF